MRALGLITIVVLAVGAPQSAEGQSPPTDPTLAALVSLHLGCRIALAKAERALENVERPGMPEDILERMRVSPTTKTELSKRKDVLNEAIKASRDIGVLEASIAVLDQEMIESFHDLDIVRFRGRVIDLADRIVRKLLDLGTVPDTLRAAACVENASS